MSTIIVNFLEELKLWAVQVFKHWPILLLFSMLVPALPYLPFSNLKNFIASTDSVVIAYVVDKDKEREKEQIGQSKYLKGIEDSINAEISSSIANNSDHPKQFTSNPKLILISPEAHTLNFNRKVPLPRAPLACFIWRLAKRLETSSEVQIDRKPVVAIDFDVTPLNPDFKINLQNPAYSCAKEIFTQGTQKERMPNDSATTKGDKAQFDVPTIMRLALRELSKVAYVTAIVFPRQANDPSVEKRNSFLRKVCCNGLNKSVNSPENCSIHLASPALFAQNRSYIRSYPALLSTNDRQEIDNSKIKRSSYFPGLGAVAYALSEGSEKGQGALQASYEYCEMFGSESELYRNLDALSLNEPSASLKISDYKFKDINLGKAEKSIRVKSVPPSTEKDLFKLAIEGMPTDAPVYFLGVETALGDDVYISPSSHIPKPGAWIHAAIFLSENSEPVSWFKKLKNYFKSVLIDIGFGLVLVAVFTFLLLAPIKKAFAKMTAIHLLLILIVPLGLTYSMAQYYMFNFTIDKFYNGLWNNPIYVICGLLFHLYIDALHHSISHEHENSSGHGKAEEQYVILSRLIEFLWCFVIFVSLAYGGLLPDYSASYYTQTHHLIVFCIVAFISLIYLLLCKRVAYLPLIGRL